jgi:2-dehydropantoate 2-reductase
VIFLGVKAHGLTQLAPQLKPLIGDAPRSSARRTASPGGTSSHLERVDPGGVIAASIDPARVVGSLVYLGTEIVEPGVIRHTEGNRISLGEPDGTRSERCRPSPRR